MLTTILLLFALIVQSQEVMPGFRQNNGIVQMKKQCYKKFNANSFYNTIWVMYDSAQYNEYYYCSAFAEACSDKTGRWDVQADGREDRAQGCAFNYVYCMDKHIYMFSYNNGSLISTYGNDWQQGRDFSYASLPVVHDMWMPTEADTILIQATSGIKGVMIPLAFNYTLDTEWANFYSVQFTQGLLEKMKKIDGVNVRFDATYGIMSDKAGININLKCILGGLLYGMNEVDIYTTCFSIKELPNLDNKEKRLKAHQRDQPNSEIENCENGFSYRDAQPKESVWINVLDNFVAPVVGLIPGIGPLVAMDIRVITTIAQKDNPADALKFIVTESGKAVGEKVWEAGFSEMASDLWLVVKSLFVDINESTHL